MLVSIDTSTEKPLPLGKGGFTKEIYMDIEVRIFEQRNGVKRTRNIKLYDAKIIDAINRYLIEEAYTDEGEILKSYTNIENINI